MANAPLKAPQISTADLSAFHELHFSQALTDSFASNFHLPRSAEAAEAAEAQSTSASHSAIAQGTFEGEYAEYDYEEEEDDGLGYYEDGVKRTLTDEQIAIFRHSELEALRRARVSSAPSPSPLSAAAPVAAHAAEAKEGAEDGELSEGEISPGTAPPAATIPKKQKKRKTRGRNKTGGEPPIDLRKRTWDIVDEGLATLDYGDEENDPHYGQGNASQRRRISYDD
ncbi:hypothetical protein B0H63DRAFT_517519 [Podospora didyma]|uniref:Uncharacterized protein n=1 Tax=Podospora didyma TaxID=330526 RepID=A0AAE0U807_9PEZI|nr:hypothetical protein B0H63DRAFT_517519 [Podospora didyma]